MPGLLRGVARTAVVAGTASAVSERVRRRQQGRWAAQEAEQAPPPAPAPEYAQAPPAAGTDDKLAQTETTRELRDAGVLTDAEFEHQEDEILYGSWPVAGAISNGADLSSLCSLKQSLRVAASGSHNVSDASRRWPDDTEGISGKYGR